MTLTNRSTVQELLSRHGISMKKKYGQNFLVSESVPARIARCGAEEGGKILEIGPGIGTMTRELAALSEQVVAVEIDGSLLPVLDETLSDLSNVRVVHGDILKTDLSALYREEFGGTGTLRVCANLPYYITTPILTYLLESSLPLRSITVMVQKEVADRLCAEPGSPEYGAITLAVRFRGTAGKCFTVPAGCFFPPPKVDSAVVRIDLFERSPFSLSEEEKKLFFACVRAAFMQRRKTLGNALAAGFPSLPKEVLRALPEEIGLSKDVRGEALSAESYARLARALSEKLRRFSAVQAPDGKNTSERCP